MKTNWAKQDTRFSPVIYNNLFCYPLFILIVTKFVSNNKLVLSSRVEGWLKYKLTDQIFTLDSELVMNKIAGYDYLYWLFRDNYKHSASQQTLKFVTFSRSITFL